MLPDGRKDMKYIYIDHEGHNGVTVSYEFIDLWTEVREWSVRPI